MSTKDNIRQRRQEKIKQLTSQRDWRAAAAPAKPQANMEPPVPFIGHRSTDEEPDPERIWKGGGNPWSTMDREHRSTYQEGWEDKPGEGGWDKFRKELQWKLAAAALLFVAIWGMYSYDAPWTTDGRSLVESALSEEMNFNSAADWYRSTFAGAPSFIPIFGDQSGQSNVLDADGTVKAETVSPLPGGSIVRTFAELLSGVELAGLSEEKVAAAETGRVLVLSEDEDKGTTVVIQHANGRSTVYGQLGSAEVKVNDWVEAGDIIGKLQPMIGEEPSLLYFAVKQNNRYVDPAGVIPID
ncbi:peptidoglycan DD-metalloendopeptidase family protein [Paenibacillus sp. GCM10023252]|uniref:peptidoglycan DD-metalloendopeptidase family protein n=1 Tax=Paenibacillus sp. GCM10023252 TaxID=3252649 RepID=UPI0036157DAD